jgi:hypothetical protein
MMGQSGTRRVSREALAPLSNEERAADGRSSKEVADFAGPWFLTLRALQLGSASRDLPLPGVNPDGQVTRGRLSWDRHVSPNRAERQATGSPHAAWQPWLISDGLAASGGEDTQATQATER